MYLMLIQIFSICLTHNQQLIVNKIKTNRIYKEASIHQITILILKPQRIHQFKELIK